MTQVKTISIPLGDALPENVDAGMVFSSDNGINLVGTRGAKPEDYEQLINYTMTYDSGNECIEVSGGLGVEGWTFTGANSRTLSVTQATKNSDNLYFASSSGEVNLIATQDLIDVSEYKSIMINLKVIGVETIGLSLYQTTTKHCNNEENRTDFSDLGKQVGIIPLAHAASYFAVCSINGQNRNGYLYNMALLKPDNYTTLCDKAGVTAPSTLEELLADTTKLTSIFNSEAAVKFMVKQCTGDFMVGVLNNETAVGLLKESPYLNMVVANVHWAKFMMMLSTANCLLNYAMAYDGGDECSEATGGWSAYNSGGQPKPYKRATYLEIDSSAGVSGGAYFVTGKEMDFTEFNKMYLLYSRSVTSYNISFGTSKNNSSTYSVCMASDQISNTSIIPKEVVTKKLISGELIDKSGKYLYINGDNTAYFYNVFLTKADNFQKWCEFGGVSADSLETLLADATAMATLMSNQKAVDYLAGCTGDLMVSICNSEVAMSALCDNIAYDTLFKHPVWYKFMTMCPVSLEVMKNVAVSIPTMTSNNTPSGKVTSSSFISNCPDYYAFDNSENTSWDSTTGASSPQWCQYEFDEEIEIFSIIVYPTATTNLRVNAQGYISIDDVKVADMNIAPAEREEYIFNPPIKGKAVKVTLTTNNSTWSSGQHEINNVWVYGKVVE